MSPLVSIVISTKNEEKNIGSCLESCLNQDYKNIELIVVDNNSVDKTCGAAREYTSKVYNYGPERSSQKNFGALKASGEYLLFLDADARLGRTVLSECVSLVQNKNYSMVIIPERHVGEGFWSEVKALERSFYLGDDAVEAPWFFHKKDFLSVGGYDEEMFAGEDWNLFDRMRAAGFKHGRCQSFINHQIGRLTFWEMVRKKFYYGTNIKVFLKKGKGKSARRNPLLRPALFRNFHYLFKSPIKYLAIFALKFFESWGISAGIGASFLKGSKLSEKELSKLMVDVFYDRRKSVNLNRKDWVRFLKLCSGNRVLYSVAKKLRRQEVVRAAEKEIGKTQQTLGFVETNLPDAILVKTCKFLPYITYDLDLLVHDRRRIEKDLGPVVKERHPGKQNRYQKNYYKKGLLQLDVHEDFYWQGFRFADVEKVFENTQTITYFGRQVRIPSYTFEFLLNCAHVLFEKRYITFLDYWYLKKLTDEEKVDWELVETQAKKYGWWKSLQLLRRKLRQIKAGREPFPSFLSWREIFRIYQEKCWFEKKLPIFDMLYYIFARLCGRLGIKTSYPYYVHWFDFEKL